MTHAALTLPEIIARIGYFLPRKSIVTCFQINSTFHSALAPLIYRHLDLYASRKPPGQPSVQTLVRYAHLVQHLNIFAFIRLIYLTAGYTSLKSILLSSYASIHSQQEGTDEEILDALLRIKRENSGLKSWKLYNPWPQFPALLWKTIASSAMIGPELDTLIVRSTIIDEKSSPWFLMACQRVRRLDLQSITVLGSESNEYLPGHKDIIPLSRLDAIQATKSSFSPLSVTFRDVLGISLHYQLEFLSRCTSLQELHWKSPSETEQYNHNTVFNVHELYPQLTDMQRLFGSKTWSSLRIVDVHGNYNRIDSEKPAFNLSDECLSYILDSIEAGRLERLICIGSQISTLGMNSLKHHFSNLCEFNARLCTGITSPMVQLILESCPRLKRIDVMEIHIRDIRKGGPWVCTQLIDLNVYFNMTLENDEMDPLTLDGTFVTNKSKSTVELLALQNQHYVFKRLAELKHLEGLDVQRVLQWSKDTTHTRSLDFSISRGLAMLSTLKEIQYLDVAELPQQLMEEDVEMMIRQWPKLRTLSGRLNLSDDIDSRLGEYLDELNISRGMSSDW
ncbi:hypothetical protein FBU30_001724 [Linnemannia zychae]|nr:hypothetical protein FBU30_001724 [Linnemannia zychae]